MERIKIQMLGGFILKTDKQTMDLIALLTVDGGLFSLSLPESRYLGDKRTAD